jgi:hypothetical protein
MLSTSTETKTRLLWENGNNTLGPGALGTTAYIFYRQKSPFDT